MYGIFHVFFVILSVSATAEEIENGPKCAHYMTGENGNIYYPGFIKFKDGEWNFYTENRSMGGMCIMYGEIPPTKDLIIHFYVQDYRWIYFGGRNTVESDWINVATIQPFVPQYENRIGEYENGTKYIMLSGYDFKFFRILFPRKEIKLTMKYVFEEHKYTSCPISDVFDIVSCTNGNKINSECKVKCKSGLAASPMLYLNLPFYEDDSHTRSLLPYMITTCRSNGFSPPTWNPDIAIKQFVSYDSDNVDPEPLDLVVSMIVSPALPLFSDDESGVVAWTNVLKDQTAIKHNTDDPQGCVALNIVTNLCFYYDKSKSIVDENTDFAISECIYPIQYLLELFGETEGTGIDPDTLPTEPPPPSTIEKMFELNKIQKAYIVTKMKQLQNSLSNSELSCWMKNYQSSFLQLQQEARNITKTEITKMLNITKEIWKEFYDEFGEECRYDLYATQTNPSKPDCLKDVRLCEWNTTANDYRFGCFDFTSGTRIRQCLTCRNPPPGNCQKTKASG